MTTTPTLDNTRDKPVVVLGAGGHARVLISLLNLIGRPIAAVLDDDSAKHGQPIGHTQVTGGFDGLDDYRPADVELINAIGSTLCPTTRQAIYEKMTARGYAFATLVHPAAFVDADATLEPGAQVMASATVQVGATLGRNCLINTGAVVDHDTTIGPHTHLAPGAMVCGGSRIGPGCHIGAGVTVIQGITVGRGTIVGAGATVVNDVEQDMIVVGTPAKSIVG